MFDPTVAGRLPARARHAAACHLVIGTLLALVVFAIGALAPRADAAVQLLAAPHTIPGSNPANDTPVLLFTFDGTAPLVARPPIPATLLDDPSYAAFDRNGDLFVTNRFGNSGPGTVDRFRLGPTGAVLGHSTITGNGLAAPHGLAFAPSGELFVTNQIAAHISRFRFAPDGSPVANGLIPLSAGGGQGVAFSPSGELFVSVSSHILRFLIDPVTGGATPNGVFTVPSGSDTLHGLAFRGNTLYVADIAGLVHRFGLSGGTPAYIGAFPVAGGPIGVAYNPTTDELFTSSHFAGQIQRFTFAPDGTPIPGSVTPTPQLGGLAVRPPSPGGARTCDGLPVTHTTVAGQPTVGTPGNDVIAGTAGPDIIRGSGGHDRLCGGGGDDELRGEAGNDVLRGEGGNDLVSGGSGDDLVSGAGGDDRLLGGLGADQLLGGSGQDRLSGGDGNDHLSGGDGNDDILGGDAADDALGGNDDDVLRGAAGDDRLRGAAGDDQLDGGAGSDACDGGTGSNVLIGCSP